MQSIALTHVSMSNLNLNHKILDVSITHLLFLNVVNTFINFLSKHDLDKYLIFFIEFTYFYLKNGGIKQMKPGALLDTKSKQKGVTRSESTADYKSHHLCKF